MKTNKSNAAKVFSGLFWKFGERICAQGVSFVVSIVLARMLLKSEYGAVSLNLVFISIANVFVTSGFSSALVQKKDADEVDFSTIFYCTTVMSIIVYGILFVIAPFVADFYGIPEVKWYLRALALKILIAAYNSVQHAYVSRHMIFKKFFFSTLIGTVISGFVGIGMAYAGFGAWAIIGQYLSNSLIDMLVLMATIPWRPKLLFSMEAAKKLVSYGWKVLATDLMGTVFSNLRSLLIGCVYTPDDLAVYNRGLQFPHLIGNNIDSTIKSVLFPAMSNYGDNPQKIKELTQRAMKTSSYMMFPMMAGLIAIGKPLVLLLLTEKWADCIIFMQVLCVSQAISTVSNANTQAIKALGRSDVILKLEFIKKPVYLVMLLASLKYGVFAVAFSMMLYSFVGTAINMQPNRTLLGYSFKEQLWDLTPAMLLSVVMCAIVMPMGNLPLPMIIIVILQTICGASIYIGLSAVFKVDSFVYLYGFFKKTLKLK